MSCNNCGNIIQPHEPFCSACGTAPQQPMQQPQMQPQKNNKNMIVIAVVVCLLALAVVVYFVFLKNDNDSGSANSNRESNKQSSENNNDRENEDLDEDNSEDDLNNNSSDEKKSGGNSAGNTPAPNRDSLVCTGRIEGLNVGVEVLFGDRGAVAMGMSTDLTPHMSMYPPSSDTLMCAGFDSPGMSCEVRRTANKLEVIAMLDFERMGDRKLKELFGDEIDFSQRPPRSEVKRSFERMLFRCN